jgi:hypothetical protein
MYARVAKDFNYSAVYMHCSYSCPTDDIHSFICTNVVRTKQLLHHCWRSIGVMSVLWHPITYMMYMMPRSADESHTTTQIATFLIIWPLALLCFLLSHSLPSVKDMAVGEVYDYCYVQGRLYSPACFLASLVPLQVLRR